MKKIDSRIFQEPYRLFFPLGIFCGFIGIGHWLVYAMGYVSAYSSTMHASIQMQTYMICFIGGFLMTAMPRLAQAKPASWIETGVLMFFIFGILSSLLMAKWVPANLFFVAALLWLLFFGFRRVMSPHRAVKGSPPVEFLWVPIALIHGILGSLLFTAGTSKVAGSWAILTGKSMTQHGFVLAVVLGVGGFLAPRLMGTFKLAKPNPNACSEIKQTNDRLLHALLHLLAGTVLLASFFLEGFGLIKIAYGVRAALVTVLMIWTRSLVLRPLMKEQYVQLLWASLWMVFLGSWAAFIFLPYRVAMLHAVFIGGYSLMTFAVATMVMTSHAGKAEQLRGRSRTLSFIAFAVLAAMFFRMASPFFPAWYFQLLGISSGFWLSAAVVWLIRMTPLILSFPDESEITRMHEESVM